MKLIIILCTFVLLHVSQPVDSSKILGVFWTPSKSHHIPGSALLQALAKKGHNVTLLSPFIDDVDIPTFKQKQLHGIAGTVEPNLKASPLELIGSFISRMKNDTALFWENKGIQDLMESREEYDVIISWNFFIDGILALNHYLGAPTIIFSPGGSSPISNMYTANQNVPYVGSSLIDTKSSNTFIDRLTTISWACFLSLMDMFLMSPIQERVTRSYLPTSPSIDQLRKNISLVLMNAHITLEAPRPYVPNLIQIGGFYAQTAQKLPDNLQKYLDSAKGGAILFSFGTNMKIKDMEKAKLNDILEGLRKISPIKVLFKSEIELENVPKNVLVTKWLPQNDILAHPNIKAFISHGGLGGITEAIYHGVPMVGIPLFGDQKANIGNAVEAGYAVRILYEDISQETVDKALKEILRNPSYAKMAKKRSSLLRNQPINPLQKAIWWVEHIIEHKGGEHLRNLGMDLEWYQLYMVDIMLFYLAVIIIFSTTSIILLRWIIRKLFSRISCKKTKWE